MNIIPEIPHNSTFTFYVLHFDSWRVAEGSGRHSYHENKEVGGGQGEDVTVPVSVHLSLPQAWC